MNDSVRVDSFEPDYDEECDVCGQSPTVTAVKDGQVIHSTGMCGVCTWGESAMLDPAQWNE